MSHRFASPKTATRNRFRHNCATRGFLPGRILWPWVAKAYGKLSARELLALSDQQPGDLQSAPPEPEHNAPPVYFPLPGFTRSKPIDPRTLPPTEAYNPERIRRLKERYERALDPNSSSRGGKADRPRDPWDLEISDAEHILIHEVSYRSPEAYQYVIRRICERAGIPVPEDMYPPLKPSENEGTNPEKAA